MTEIHHMIAGAAVGDAITNYAFEIRNIFRESGIHSEVYAPYQHIAPSLRKEVHPVLKNMPIINKKNITLFYQFSIGSVMTEYFMHSPGRKVLCYQNITPEHYFRGMNDQTARKLFEGREELKKLVNVPDITLATSKFNATELEELGYKNIHNIPLALNTNYLLTKPSQNIINSYNDNYTNFLFVGRVTPNKKLENVLKVFYYYNKTINPSSRLIFAGGYDHSEKYLKMLLDLAKEMELKNVVFTSHVSLEDLLGFYSASTLFLCMSEHEGVCIPLIESMYFQKPVFALAKAAVPGTMGGTGILLQKKNYREIAELIDVVLKDSNMLKNIIEKQNNRINNFKKENLKKQLQQILGF
ncbi:MAG: glycosyltransferase [Candidatus Aureabacteria bacterium]|nr:glycosyltransferase [Candidatus Auribacterota bacterium]